MRLLHLIFAVLVVALALAIARDPTGRVALVVFLTGGALFALGTTAVMMLFRTLGGLGHARGLAEHAEAAAATVAVLLLATIAMNAVLWAGAAVLMATLNSIGY